MKNYYFGNEKRWLLDELPEVTRLQSDYIPDLIYRILAQRGIKDQEEALAFLNPSLETLHDPFLMDGMDTAVDRIIDAIKNNEKILVYGDYDVDGVAATSILVRFFRTHNIQIEYYIPDRVDEGYGISDIAVEYIINNDYDLIITVDCGITACEQVKAIYDGYRSKGRKIDIIVTDHHQCNEKMMPEALVVIDPHVPDCKYPYKNLCGAGLALKLVQGICMRLNIPDKYKDYLDLAALATIADIVELKGENRIIAKYGIDKISSNPCTGIKSLIKVSQLNNIDAYSVSFGLAPRVNAAGRMGDAKLAVELFTTDDREEADRIAYLLNQSNSKRKEIQDEIFESAVKTIEENPRYKSDKVLVVWGEDYHHGVIGIVASKLVECYHKPAIVLSIEDEKAVGSARSIDGFNIFKAFEEVSDILIKYGGHERAGGLSLRTEDLRTFREMINICAGKYITDEMLTPAVNINLEVTEKDISIENARLISRLEPFGPGNQMPVFCLRNKVIESKKVIGNGKHLSLCLNINGKLVNAIYFGKGYLDAGLFLGDVVDIIFTQEVNVWQNVESLQLRILDMRLNELELKRNRFFIKAIHQAECLDSDCNWLYNGIIDKLIDNDDILVNRNDLALIYKYIIRMEQKTFSLTELFIHSKKIEKNTRKNMNGFKFFIGLLAFKELGLLKLELNPDEKYEIIIYDDVEKVDLNDSEMLNWVRSAVRGFKP